MSRFIRIYNPKVRSCGPGMNLNLSVALATTQETYMQLILVSSLWSKGEKMDFVQNKSLNFTNSQPLIVVIVHVDCILNVCDVKLM